jgi:hypothetical protein
MSGQSERIVGRLRNVRRRRRRRNVFSSEILSAKIELVRHNTRDRK